MSPSQGGLAQSVLCGVDFSAHSRPALRYAALIATRLKRPLTVLFVNDPLLVAAAAYAYDQRAFEEQTVQDLERVVRRAVGRMLPTEIDYVVTTGQPARELADTAARLKAPLVAIGTHRLGGAGSVPFGSTAADLLSKSRVPVLAVPSSLRRRPADDWPGPQIAMAVDASDELDVDVGAAAEFADHLRLGLVVLHVRLPSRHQRWFMLRHKDSQETNTDDDIGAKRARVHDVAGRVETEVLSGDPADAIGAFLRTHRIGLVMLTSRVAAHGHRAVLHEVLAKVSTPVLARPGRHRSER